MGYSGNMYAQATEVITSQGDLRRGDSSGNPERLAIGSNTFVLSSNGTTESWSAPATPTNIQYDVAAMSGVDFDFDSTDAVQTLSISANTTFTGSNYADGKSITLFITTDGSLRTLAFPSGWIFQGTKPTDQAASKVGTLTLLCSSTSEASVRAAYAVEA